MDKAGKTYERLVVAHLDTGLDDEDAQRLHGHLRADPGARRYLLAAARQAAAWPRLAQEDGGASAAKPPSRLPGLERLLMHAAAALLAVALGTWLVWRWDRGRGPQLRVDGDQVAIMSAAGSRPASADPWLGIGDIVTTGADAAHLVWNSDGTGVELDPHSRLHITSLGELRRLDLQQGRLTADVVHLQSGGFQVGTAFGLVQVMGTRFSVEVRAHSSVVGVERGTVALSLGPNSRTVPLPAGFSAVLDGRTISPESPLGQVHTAWPTTPRASLNPGTLRHVHVGPADWMATAGAGWEGILQAGAIQGHPVDPSVTRIMTPLRRPGGYAVLAADVRCTVAVGVDRATTLAICLVCDLPGRAGTWIGNVQGERSVGPGMQTVSWSLADLRPVAGFRTRPPLGCRVVAMAVMSWVPAAQLGLTGIDLTWTGSAVAP